MNDLPKGRYSASTSLVSVVADAAVILTGYLIYTRAPFFNTVLSAKVIAFLPIVGACLLTASVFSYLFEGFYRHRNYRSTSYKAFVYLFSQAKTLAQRRSVAPNADKGHEHAFFIVLVKLFYVPLMLQFTISNFLFLSQYVLSGENGLSGSFFPVFNQTVYPFLVGACFFVDTVFFLFGYLIYSDALGNTIRTVETTFLGWAVALLCYPPINHLTATFIPALYHDHPETGSSSLNFVLRIAMLAFLLVYTMASVNLGWKCSNLTNRGIVTHGVYSVVRHPAYVAKNVFWWLSLLPIVMDKPMAIVYMTGWSFLYFLRAVTEERHLRLDPDYVAYCEKVKYRFIPKLY